MTSPETPEPENPAMLSRPRRLKRLLLIASGAAVLLGPVVAELAARASGLTNFPLYIADSHIGYIPAPSQSGSFLHSNDWVFNEISMGTPRPFSPTDTQRDILLVGDSIVYGGNPSAQAERLGPQPAAASGAVVWPIGAGSWGLQNELTYLRDHPEVASSVDEIVFVLNGGDFSGPSMWRSEQTHPRTRPLSALAYLLMKYVSKSEPPETPPDLRVAATDWRRDFAAFAA